jgi:hypothetical protein
MDLLRRGMNITPLESTTSMHVLILYFSNMQMGRGYNTSTTEWKFLVIFMAPNLCRVWNFDGDHISLEYKANWQPYGICTKILDW